RDPADRDARPRADRAARPSPAAPRRRAPRLRQRRAGGTGVMTRALRRYASLHAKSLASAVGRLAGQPVATLLTVLVIAIALALPAGLRVLVGNAAAVAGSWQGAADFSAYLEPDITADRAREIAGVVEH